MTSVWDFLKEHKEAFTDSANDKVVGRKDRCLGIGDGLGEFDSGVVDFVEMGTENGDKTTLQGKETLVGSA